MNLDKRRAGILLHPTSFPAGSENGVLGKDAFQFVDFLVQSGLSVWQLLPLGPTHGDKSPYQSLSAHAGNPDLICWQSVMDESWVDNNAISSNSGSDICALMYQQFINAADSALRDAFEHFTEVQSFWLDDYAQFVVAKKQYEDRSWVEWPAPLRNREKIALENFENEFADAIDTVKFEQFIFFKQWLAIKRYANERNVQLFGDLPLFVAHDSSDVWAHREYFKLDGEGHSLFVAGVPPDYFSETGQLWGNPVYDWRSIASDAYSFWVERLKTQLSLFDLVRIDHFRGLEAYWEIPADHDTALNGYWVKGPGEDFFAHLKHYFGDNLPLVAEDLGFITEEVLALRRQFSLSGMKILQFAFDSDSKNPYLPHHHERLSVVYTGTHDNNTTCGWFNGLDEAQQQRIFDYFGNPKDEMPWLLIRAAMMSPANLAVVPLQDFLSLDETHRMNVPGTVEGNWQWRFDWKDHNFVELAARVKRLAEVYGRL